MFKKLTVEDVSTRNLLKASAYKSIRVKLLTAFPKLESCIEDILPKKASMTVVKVPNHGTLVLNPVGEPIVFQIRDEPWCPTLQVLQKYRDVLPTMQCDYGAIKYVLRGANVMCAGLTSAGGRVEDNVPAGTIVQIIGEGKTSPCAVGRMTMSSEEIRETQKGVCIETYHVLGDGLWNTKRF